MILTFEITVDTPDSGNWIPYIKSDLLRDRNRHYQVKSVVPVPYKTSRYFETIEKDAIERGQLGVGL